MKGYRPYAEALDELVGRVASEPTQVPLAAVAAALDGEASRALRETVALAERRSAGAFFTSSSLAEAAWSLWSSSLTLDSVVADPACGAGSLLLPAISRLRKAGVPADDLLNRIYGFDLSAEFVRASRSRLILGAASSDGMQLDHTEARESLLRNIREGDMYAIEPDLYQKFSHVVLNPPYVSQVAPGWFSLSSGTVNSAAVMVAHCLNSVKAGTRVLAILPDVLKSGSRYARWRSWIGEQAEIDYVVDVGQFDDQTDVHVFVLSLQKRHSEMPGGGRTAWQNQSASRGSTATIGDLFKVSVGPVVQYRDPESAEERPFAQAKRLGPDVISEELPRRKFIGRGTCPPFVVVRRTSRPGDLNRAKPTLVRGEEVVAVDNHLLILQPRNGDEELCEWASQYLSSFAVSEWLDNDYKCRHLTVGAVRDIPLDLPDLEAVHFD